MNKLFWVDIEYLSKTLTGSMVKLEKNQIILYCDKKRNWLQETLFWTSLFDTGSIIFINVNGWKEATCTAIENRNHTLLKHWMDWKTLQSKHWKPKKCAKLMVVFLNQ